MHATLQSDHAHKRKLAALEDADLDQEPQAPPDDTFVDADTHLMCSLEMMSTFLLTWVSDVVFHLFWYVSCFSHCYG
jgi:hypothetical protein